MRAHGYNRVTPVHGYYKPREIRRNGIRIAGWDHVTKSGAAVEFDGTYNDRLAIEIAGTEELRADWRAQEGVLSQTVTVQGKNLCPNDFGEWESGDYSAITGLKTVYPSRIRLKRLIIVSPSTTYYTNNFNTDPTWNFRLIFRVFDAYGVFVRSIGSVGLGATITTDTTEQYISVSMYEITAQATFEDYQNSFANGYILPFVCLNTETNKSFAAFVPNSPSPDYQSVAVSNVPVGSYRLPCTGAQGGWWILTLADNMRGIGSFTDKIELDLMTGKGKTRKKILKKVFDGGTSITWDKNADDGEYISFYFTKGPHNVASGISNAGFCSHAPYHAWTPPAGNYWWEASGSVGMRIHSSYLIPYGYTAELANSQKVNCFKGYLAAEYSAGHPMIAYCIAATETVTPLTMTWTASSDLPDLPGLTSLGITTPSATYPFTRHVSGDCDLQISDASVVRQEILVPVLRAVGDVRDTLTYTGDDAWEHQPRIGHIDAYAGETITTAYSSATGALTTGADVDYVLPEFPEPETLTLGPPLTYPRYTAVDTDGDVNPIITATAKVVAS